MLTGKQRSYLRGLANREDTILQIGKGGITENLLVQTDKALTAREIVKGRVLENSLMTAREACDMLAEKTGSEQVQVIGSRFVIYRANSDKQGIRLPE